VAPLVPGRSADESGGGARPRQSQPAERLRLRRLAISPPSDVGAYNDGYTNDPIWTGQAVDWLKQHARQSQPWLCVLSLLNPHDIQFYPRGFRVDWKRPDYDAQLEPSFYAEPTLKDKPSGQDKFRHVVQIISGSPRTRATTPSTSAACSTPTTT